jgi:hypothetical protein
MRLGQRAFRVKAPGLERIYAFAHLPRGRIDTRTRTHLAVQRGVAFLQLLQFELRLLVLRAHGG